MLFGFFLTAGATLPLSAAGGAPLLLRPLLPLLDDHIERATHLDGPRCPMYPSCSAYGRQALREAGWHGLLLTIDRLFFREHGDYGRRYHVAPSHLSEAPRLFDPLDDSLFGSEAPSLFAEELRRYE